MTDALALLLLLWPTGSMEACRITRAVDGDTIAAECGRMEERIRLFGIDTPEMNSHRRDPAEPGAEAATEALASMLRTRVLVGTVDHVDGFGRPVVTLEMPDGRDLGCTLVTAGHAELTSHANRRSGYCDGTDETGEIGKPEPAERPRQEPGVDLSPLATFGGGFLAGALAVGLALGIRRRH